MLKIKRISAYLIDMFMMLTVISIICVLTKIDLNTNLLDNVKGIIQEYRFGDYTFFKAYHYIAIAVQSSDKLSILNVLVAITTMIFTWIIIPLTFYQQTIGMKIMHIRMNIDNKRKYLSIIIRSLLLSGLGIFITLSLFLYLVSADIYTLLLIILVIGQIILIIYDLFMILYNNESNLIDKFSQTKIIEVKK